MRWVVKVLDPVNKYLEKAPGYGSYFKWTDDIYRARFYKTKKTAQKDGQYIANKFYQGRNIVVDFEIIKVEIVEHGKEL